MLASCLLGLLRTHVAHAYAPGPAVAAQTSQPSLAASSRAPWPVAHVGPSDTGDFGFQPIRPTVDAALMARVSDAFFETFGFALVEEDPDRIAEQLEAAEHARADLLADMGDKQDWLQSMKGFCEKSLEEKLEALENAILMQIMMTTRGFNTAWLMMALHRADENQLAALEPETRSSVEALRDTQALCRALGVEPVLE